MTICPIALAVSCEKCPAFIFCPLTTFLGDQQEENKIDSSKKLLENRFLPEKKNQITITGTNTYDSVRSKLKSLEKEFEVWEKSYPPEKKTENLKKDNLREV